MSSINIFSITTSLTVCCNTWCWSKTWLTWLEQMVWSSFYFEYLPFLLFKFQNVCLDVLQTVTCKDFGLLSCTCVCIHSLFVFFPQNVLNMFLYKQKKNPHTFFSGLRNKMFKLVKNTRERYYIFIYNIFAKLFLSQASLIKIYEHFRVTSHFLVYTTSLCYCNICYWWPIHFLLHLTWKKSVNMLAMCFKSC